MVNEEKRDKAVRVPEDHTDIRVLFYAPPRHRKPKHQGNKLSDFKGKGEKKKPKNRKRPGGKGGGRCKGTKLNIITN